MLCIREASFRLEPRCDAGIAIVGATLEEVLSDPLPLPSVFSFQPAQYIPATSVGEQWFYSVIDAVVSAAEHPANRLK